MTCRSVFLILILSFLLIPASIVEVHADYQRGVEAYEAGDYETAYKELIDEAEQGNADAQYYIGHMYWMGYGGEQNYEKAIKWFRKANDQGHNTDRSYLEPDYPRGLEAYEAGDYETAYKEFNFAAKRGSHNAQYYLGYMYWFGLGIEADREEAIKWLQKAAYKGNDKAKSFLDSEVAAISTKTRMILGLTIVITLILYVFCVRPAMTSVKENMNWRTLIVAIFKNLRMPLSIFCGVLGFIFFYFFGLMYAELEQSKLGPVGGIIPFIAGLVGAFIGSRIWWLKSDVKDKNKDMKSDGPSTSISP